MSEVTQLQKTVIFLLKFNNSLLEKPFLKNNLFLKAFYKATIRAYSEFRKVEIRDIYKEANQLYKEFDEIDDEQLDENELEMKNNLGEIVKESNLFLKKFYEDEEGENEKKLKNKIIEVFEQNSDKMEVFEQNSDKIIEVFEQNSDKIKKEQK